MRGWRRTLSQADALRVGGLLASLRRIGQTFREARVAAINAPHRNARERFLGPRRLAQPIDITLAGREQPVGQQLRLEHPAVHRIRSREGPHFDSMLQIDEQLVIL